MKQALYDIGQNAKTRIGFALALTVMAILIGYYTVTVGIILPVSLALIALLAVCLIVLVKYPVSGLMGSVIYCFILPIIGRESMIFIPWGIGLEIILILTLVVTFFNKHRTNWADANNDMVKLVVMWFGISVLQIANPSGASVVGWVNEIRGTALNMLLIVPLGCAVMQRKRYLDLFLYIVIAWSVIGALNGIKQLHIGLFPGEERFLLDNLGTHLIRGVIRVFSFYTDAGQFGASMSHIALVSGILAMGPFKLWKRLLLVAIGCLLFYAMMISGTRGALFVLSGGLVGLFLTKNFRVLVVGILALGMLFSFLKFTDIGQGSYQIRRLRSAVNPENDPSFIVRLNSQMKLADYLKYHPFGGGLGTIGGNGKEYNGGTFLASIEPDSYWVKVWAMYGIVGLIIWFGMNMYIMGKCCGIIWRINDPILRIKLIALISGAIGIFVASYGNEVINRTPSSILVFISWAVIYNARKWDEKSS
ncbi:O-antigen ligase family protein [Parapedobacter sp. 10938]|uniref:O-antigen ligase family protein n=1 Tax=Parapedobacter flavus TaxID=3110225 RepID=UPI002DB65494|nr:O-antigen ligase family protein [Parapedobacter sp. 10938]MEC3879898.1 O-antigen ligase family protein [Parapedobacter sp. 10938]